MCNNVKEIKFCSCEGNPDPIIHHKNSRKHKRERNSDPEPTYKWSLSKHVGDSELMMDGMLMEPSTRLKQITDSELLLELNTRNCFDFEYHPNEGDNLNVWIEYPRHQSPISFIFENNRWAINQYNTFTDKIERFHFGSVKFDQ